MLTALTSVVALSGGQLLVVDSTGAGDFTQIQDAVDAALDGDTILVRPPPGFTTPYRPFRVVDKDLDILGEPGTHPRVEWFQVRDLGASREVVVENLEIEEVVDVIDCAGPVRLHALSGSYAPRVSLQDCADVVLWNCDLGGALHAFGSQLAVYDCRVWETWMPAGDGGPGILLDASVAWLSGVRAQGGSGEDTCPLSLTCYDGGPGLHMVHSSVAWTTSETSFAGGPPGWCGASIFSCELGGEFGPEVEVDPSSILQPVVGTTRAFEVSPFTGSEGTLLLEARGSPGDRVFLRSSPKTKWHVDFQFAGVDHIAKPGPGETPVRIPIGRIPWSGTLTMEVPPDALPSGSDRATYLQPEFKSKDRRTLLGGLLRVTRLPEGATTTCPERFYVDGDAPPGGDGLSWSTAYDDLADALEAVDGARSTCPDGVVEVWVAEATYRPRSQSSYFGVDGPVRIYGGFAGGEQSIEERDWIAHPTILSGDLNGDDLPGFQNVTDNSPTLLAVSSCCSWPRTRLWSRVDGLVLEAAYGGTAPLVLEGTALVSCTVRNHHLDSPYSGAVNIERGSVQGCRIEGNRNDGLGAGGAWAERCELRACRFVDNEGGLTGALRLRTTGGLDELRENRTVTVADCVFAGNRADLWSGAYVLTDGQVLLAGNTFFAQRAGRGTGGCVQVEPFPPQVVLRARFTNNVLWDNTAAGAGDETTQVRWDPQVRATLSYNCIHHLATYSGPGNHGLDPLFVDPFGPDGQPGTPDDDLRLGDFSPCVDAGHNAWRAPDVLDSDEDGNRLEPAPFDAAGDPRAVDDPDVVDTGKGQAPVVDMGARERQAD